MDLASKNFWLHKQVHNSLVQVKSRGSKWMHFLLLQNCRFANNPSSSWNQINWGTYTKQLVGESCEISYFELFLAVIWKKESLFHNCLNYNVWRWLHKHTTLSKRRDAQGDKQNVDLRFSQQTGRGSIKGTNSKVHVQATSKVVFW